MRAFVPLLVEISEFGSHALDAAQNSIAGRCEGADFVFHVFGDDPGFTAVEEDCDTCCVKQLYFGLDGKCGAPPEAL